MSTAFALQDSDEVDKPKEAALPTYKTIAEVLEKKTGSGIKLVGWTFARAALITPPMLIVGVPWKKAVAGSLLASTFISIFALVRIYNSEFTASRAYFQSKKWATKKVKPPLGMKRIR